MENKMVQIIENMICVNCGYEKLQSSITQITCFACGQVFSIKDGIPDMLLEKNAKDRNIQINVDFYDKNAPLYDKEWAEYEEWQVELREKFIHHAKSQASVPYIVELACGPGRDLEYFNKHGCKMVGADLSYGQLSLAQKKVDVPLFRTDMCSLPFGSNLFDALWCCVALIHVSRINASKALQQMVRVLKPGGVLFISVLYGEGTMEVKRKVYNETPEIYELYKENEFAKLLNDAGFEIKDTIKREAFHNRKTSEISGGVKTYIDIFAIKN